MHKKLFVLALVASVPFIQACTDNAKPMDIPDGGLICADGTCTLLENFQPSGDCDSESGIKCDGNSLMACVSGDWKKVHECSYGCDKGACKLPECSEGKQCDATGKIVQVCTNGLWKTETECDFACKDGACSCDADTKPVCDGDTLISCHEGTVEKKACPHGCTDNACVSECEAGATECVDTGMRTCGDDGLWGAVEPCELGCFNNACAACEEGSVMCSEDELNVLLCSEGAWTIDEPCELGCRAGSCLTGSCSVEEEGMQRCLDDFTLQACEQGAWGTKEICEDVCSENACITSECINGSSVCSADGKSIIKCENYRLQDPTPCEYGCANNMCLVCSDEESPLSCDNKTVRKCIDHQWVSEPEPCEIGCKDGICLECVDTPLVCGEDGISLSGCMDGQIVDKKCDYKCADGACVNKYIEECEASCKFGKCELGVCVTDNMKTLKPNEECSLADFVEFCQGDEAVFCSEGGKVVRNDCGSEGGCTMVPNYADGDKLVAVCRGNAGACTQNREKQFYCTQNAFVGIYESYNECLLNTEGTYTAVNAVNNRFLGNLLGRESGSLGAQSLPYVQCDVDGCDDKTEHCVNGDKYYLDLDEKGIIYECSESQVVSKNNYDDGAFIGGKTGAKVSAVDNCSKGTVCVQSGKGAKCESSCAGQKEGKHTICTVDNSGNYYSMEETCELDDKGSLYRSLQENPQNCPHGCADDKMTCKKLVDNEGSA